MTSTLQCHVLVVDDSPILRAAIKKVVKLAGVPEDRIFEAGNGVEALEVLETVWIDLVLLDLNLPGQDGLDICRNLRRLGNIPIIMLTAKGEDVDRIVGLEVGADDYLGKPFNPRELLARVHAVLRRRPAHSDI